MYGSVVQFLSKRRSGIFARKCTPHYRYKRSRDRRPEWIREEIARWGKCRVVAAGPLAGGKDPAAQHRIIAAEDRDLRSAVRVWRSWLALPVDYRQSRILLLVSCSGLSSCVLARVCNCLIVCMRNCPLGRSIFVCFFFLHAAGSGSP
eukprot:COSAG05_NODE_204_length_14187_cov_99.887422_2_plen_148_part_00